MSVTAKEFLDKFGETTGPLEPEGTGDVIYAVSHLLPHLLEEVEIFGMSGAGSMMKVVARKRLLAEVEGLDPNFHQATINYWQLGEYTAPDGTEYYSEMI